MNISIIVAASINNVIGANNDLPWRLPNDLKHFKQLTTGHHIIMGRKNYESIGRALPNRTSIVISRQPDYRAEGCIVVKSLKKAYNIVANKDEEVFIIGGGEIYRQTIDLANKIYLTRVETEIAGDIYFPVLGEEWVLISEEKRKADEKHRYNYTFLVYERKS